MLKKKVYIYAQFSNRFYDKVYKVRDIEKQYIERIYNKDGYYKTEHWFEIPTWIAQLSFIHRRMNVTNMVYNIESVEAFMDYIKIKSNDSYITIFFSVMDVNIEVIKNIISKLNRNKIKCDIKIGGYCKFEEISIKFYNSMGEYAKTVNPSIPYIGEDYYLFKGIKIIPRLKLSSGCKYNCKFCTIENEIIQNSKTAIFQSLNNICENLKFKYIYIDDKTFGDAYSKEELIKLMDTLYHTVKSRNKDFLGFIVQTIATPKYANLILQIPSIKLVELGIEIFDDEVLKLYNKPINKVSITEAMIQYSRSDEIKVIPNIIIGFKEATIDSIENTLAFLNNHKNIISHINVFNYTNYDNEEDNELIRKGMEIEDEYYKF